MDHSYFGSKYKVIACFLGKMDHFYFGSKYKVIAFDF